MCISDQTSSSAKEESVYYDENTLLKVSEVMIKHGLNSEDSTDLISMLLSEGILFRERAH